MKKIKDKAGRENLGEGRDYGIGFSILEKTDKDKYNCLMPFTACKDYLNDFIFVESEKKTIGVAYGYNHEILNCFDGKDIFYLGVNTLHRNGGGNWADFDKAKKLLIERYQNLQQFINRFEEMLKLPSRTVIILDEDTLIFESPIFWTKTTALISVFTLIIRCYFNITEEELKLSTEEIITNHKTIISSDNYMKNLALTFYNNSKKNKKVFLYKYKDVGVTVNAMSVHNFGIQAAINRLKLQPNG
ncbi:MAG TPA: hypothetical protein VF680_17245 [Allosphingosinicella sp.]|jgi:hypothetical protein